jgi:hypothetical protein
MRYVLMALVSVLFLAPAASVAEMPAKDTPVDKAVEKALAYLNATQDKTDGGWRSQGANKSAAVTSLAVMAFLSAGHVPGEGRYGETVEKGVLWVLKQQRPNGLIATENAGGQEMYHHGIATLMLAEVAGMTEGPLAEEVRKKLEKAVAVILKAQRTQGGDRGGWRYHVAPIDQPASDISVTGWQVMALRAAKNLGCDVPAEKIDAAVGYVKRCQDGRTGGFRYVTNGPVTVPCTGTSILALEICGKDRHHTPEALSAGAYLLRAENLPRWGSHHFFYSIYYGAQATFQLGENFWSAYRPRLHEALLRNQAANGRWEGGDTDGSYGANYGTAMAVLALTVEYRFLPIYQRGEEPTDAGK